MTRLADVLVPEGSTLRGALELMNRSGRQIVLVVDLDRRLLGLVTDGDVRKAILRGTTLEAKVDALCRSVEELRQIVCAQAIPASAS